MIFQIKLAGKIIEIRSLYELVYSKCKAYVVSKEAFLKPDIIVEIHPSDLERELRKLYPEEKAGQADFFLEHKADYFETLVVYRKIAEAMPQYETILMHGSVVATEGNGYMITANPGVGKTTRTKLWIENIPGSVVVNGDKPLMKITPDAVFACGTPWGGKENWQNNISVPLRAIFLLERVKEGESSLVEEISFGNAFSTLVKQTYHTADFEFIRKTLQLLKAFDGKVKFYRFRSAPTVEDVRLAYETARVKF